MSRIIIEENEYDKAWLKIKYVRNLLITENIDVFNIVRIPNLYEFASYFTQTENISQKIVITMVFIGKKCPMW